MCKKKFTQILKQHFSIYLHNSGYPEIKFEKKIDFENFTTNDLIKKFFFKLVLR